MIWPILYIGYIGLFRPSFTRALTLPPIQDLTPSASLVNKTLPTALTIESAAPPANFSYGRLPDPVCNGALLGFDMNKYSCLQTWVTIPIERDILTFGDRNRGFDVELPRRFSGRKCSLLFDGTIISRMNFQTDVGPYTKADGTCVIDIFHKDGVVVDTASYGMISRAAEKLYGTCVAIGAQRTQGGYIRDLGRNRGLVVVLSIYQPSVSCYGRQFSVKGADQLMQELLAMIPVNTERQKFGPEGEPGVKVVLPVTYISPQETRLPQSQRLRTTVDVEHRDAVTARWFDVWAGAVAVTARCTVKGYSGTSGVSSGLSVTVEAVRGQVMGNETAVS